MSAVTSAGARGGMVTLAGQIAKLALLFLNLIILGRMLTPADFGLFAMIMAVLGVAELLRDLGITAGAIQARSLTQLQRSNLFWISAGLGLLLALAFAALAPAISLAYGQPQLTAPIIVISSVFFMNGVQSQFQVHLARQHRFTALAASDVAAQAFALCVAVVLAATGAGYWSLVVGQVVAALVLLMSRTVAAGWIPSLPSRNTSVRSIVRFGWQLSASQVLGYIANNMAVFALGVREFVDDAGYYSRAYQIVSVPVNQLFGPLTNVALATLSRVEDPSSFSRTMVRLITAIGVTASVIFSAMFVGAPYLVPMLLGPGWSGVVVPLQVLSVATMFQSLIFPYFWIFTSRGLTSLLLKFNIATKLLTAALAVTGSAFGATGAACGFAVGFALSWPVCAWFTRTAMSGAARAALASASRSLARFAITALLGGIVSWITAPAGTIPAACAALGCWAVVWFLLICMRSGRRDLGILQGFLTRARSRS